MRNIGNKVFAITQNIQNKQTEKILLTKEKAIL